MGMGIKQEQDAGVGIICDLYRKITFLSEKHQNVSLNSALLPILITTERRPLVIFDTWKVGED